MRAVQRFKRRQGRDDLFPAFLFVSITNACNLRCQGCWVTPSNPPRHLDRSVMARIVETGRQQGCFFYGLLGGEPFLHPDLFAIVADHPDCYFQVFTNGTLIDDEAAATMRKLGNVTPLISIEGLEAVSDIRRGGTDVYARTMAGLEACRRHRLITGVATSVCRSNFDDLVSEDFARRLVDLGVHYLWYYVYRPVGPRPSPELVLDRRQILALRRFMVELRTRVPLAVVDAYWDHLGRGLCPAAVGISHHVNPYGCLEPCPIIQFARENLAETDDIAAAVMQSEFLRDFRRTTRGETMGCILMEDPEALHELVCRHDAMDCTGRGSGLDELRRACRYQSHNIPGEEIPEKHWAYRFAKKHWFFGFGTYG